MPLLEPRAERVLCLLHYNRCFLVHRQPGMSAAAWRFPETNLDKEESAVSALQRILSAIIGDQVSPARCWRVLGESRTPHAYAVFFVTATPQEFFEAMKAGNICTWAGLDELRVTFGEYGWLEEMLPEIEHHINEAPAA
ncbi:MAG TPA: hypothetical protein VMC43_03125 [Candidatus Paceibacterota bacterium]|nr:hypothetical protein [Candidatus Paceibacterota bacterium]